MFKKILCLQFFYFALVVNAGIVYRYEMPSDDQTYEQEGEAKKIYESPIQSKTITSSIVNTKVTNITYYPIEVEEYQPNQEVEYAPEDMQETNDAVQYKPSHMEMYKTESYGECTESDHLTPVEYDCQKFKMCAKGKLIILSCPNDLVFDLELKICNFRENVNGPCGNNKPIYY